MTEPPPPPRSALPQLEHGPHSTTDGALVRMFFLPDASVRLYTEWEAQFFMLLNITAAEQKNIQQTEQSRTPLNAYKSKMQDGASCMETHLTIPSTAISETMWYSCLLIIKGMHLLVKGQSEDARSRSPLLPSKSMCTFNSH